MDLPQEGSIFPKLRPQPVRYSTPPPPLPRAATHTGKTHNSFFRCAHFFLPKNHGSEDVSNTLLTPCYSKM